MSSHVRLLPRLLPFPPCWALSGLPTLYAPLPQASACFTLPRFPIWPFHSPLGLELILNPSNMTGTLLHWQSLPLGWAPGLRGPQRGPLHQLADPGATLLSFLMVSVLLCPIHRITPPWNDTGPEEDCLEAPL